MAGSLSCLNVSGGDITIEFDHENAAEAIRAKRMITDMLKRGYALLIETSDGTYTRCKKFLPDVGKYIVADFDNKPETKDEDAKIETPEKNVGKIETRGRKSKTKEIPMATAKARAVAPSSGG